MIPDRCGKWWDGPPLKLGDQIDRDGVLRRSTSDVMARIEAEGLGDEMECYNITNYAFRWQGYLLFAGSHKRAGINFGRYTHWTDAESAEQALALYNDGNMTDVNSVEWQYGGVLEHRDIWKSSIEESK